LDKVILHHNLMYICNSINSSTNKISYAKLLTLPTMQNYRKGETITLVLPQPQAGWDGMAFSVLIFRNTKHVDVEITKEQCTLNASNEYEAVVPSETTSAMTAGLYNVEVVCSLNGSVGIQYTADCFVLHESAYNTQAHAND
jgi:hypothetical protein